MCEFFGVGLFAKVKMWRQGVLEEVNQQVADKNKEGGALRVSSGDLKALRHHLDQSSREHESGTQCDEVFEVPPLPIALHDDRATKGVGGGCGQAEEQADKDGVHANREYTRG